jgi:hypothetical protein
MLMENDWRDSRCIVTALGQVWITRDRLHGWPSPYNWLGASHRYIVITIQRFRQQSHSSFVWHVLRKQNISRTDTDEIAYSEMGGLPCEASVIGILFDLGT